MTQQIRNAAKNPNSVFLDARSLGEIQQDPCNVPAIHGETGSILENAISVHLSKKLKGTLYLYG